MGVEPRGTVPFPQILAPHPVKQDRKVVLVRQIVPGAEAVCEVHIALKMPITITIVIIIITITIIITF